jgi:predicted component of type VI protein secretion system
MPVVHHRGLDGTLLITSLAGSTEIVIGRRAVCAIGLTWDASVSRVHAILRPHGAEWVIVDDGLSRNGTFVNGERVTSARRLVDGSAIVIGSTLLTFRLPKQTYDGRTESAPDHPGQLAISPAQRRVLAALCDPMSDLRPDAGPASNRQIADDLYLSVDTVKSHLRALTQLFSVDHLPQNQRRYALAQSALRWGLVRRGGAA